MHGETVKFNILIYFIIDYMIEKHFSFKKNMWSNLIYSIPYAIMNLNLTKWLRFYSRVRLKPDGTWWRTGGEVKGKLANGVGSQYSHTTSERGESSITNADAHTSAASSRLNWRLRRFKWTRPFRRKNKSGFCACAITFQTHCNIRSKLR